MNICHRLLFPLTILLAQVCPFVAHAQAFLNPSFETPVVATNGFVSIPAGTEWLFLNASNGNAGIANGQSPWGQGAAAGQQYAFIQGRGSLSQTIFNLEPGSQYQLKFAMARRNGGQGADEANRIAIFQDTILLNMVRPVDEVWRTYTSAIFTATESSHTFHFRGLFASDSTTLVDVVRFAEITAPVDIVQNGGFEVPAFAPGGWNYEANYLENGGWYFQPQIAFSTGAGIGSVGSPWGISAAEGNQFAYIQRSAFITQTLNNLVVGQRYSVSFAGTIRPGLGTHSTRVLIDTTRILTATFTSTNWIRCETASFVATSPSMTLRFEGVDTGTDSSSLIDDVVVFLTPPVARITGRVTLQGSVNQGQPLLFVFRPTDGSAAFQRNVTLNGDGTYAIADIPRQTYTVWVKGEKWLAKTIAVSATISDIPNINLALIGGDANNDNAVNIFDLLAVVKAYNTGLGQSNYNVHADINVDNTVDYLDLSLVIFNYNQSGTP